MWSWLTSSSSTTRRSNAPLEDLQSRVDQLKGITNNFVQNTFNDVVDYISKDREEEKKRKLEEANAARSRRYRQFGMFLFLVLCLLFFARLLYIMWKQGKLDPMIQKLKGQLRSIKLPKVTLPAISLPKPLQKWVDKFFKEDTRSRILNEIIATERYD